MNEPNPMHEHRQRTRRMPQRSFVYDRIIPVIFILLGLFMMALILIALGVLLGYVRYQ
jgi:uncharacterized membrane protein